MIRNVTEVRMDGSMDDWNCEKQAGEEVRMLGFRASSLISLGVYLSCMYGSLSEYLVWATLEKHFIARHPVQAVHDRTINTVS